MPRIISIARSNPTRSCSARCSDTTAGTSSSEGAAGVSVAMGRECTLKRMWATRLRWRLRGASQWPAFVLFTTLEAILLNELPLSGDGPGGLFAGVLIAGFANLFVIAVLAPLAGRLV